MSSALASQLRKVTTPWQGPPLRTAGGHLVTPTGMCTARVRVRASTFTGSFLVLPVCSRPLILGLDFLREHGAIIDLRDLQVSFEDPFHPEPENARSSKAALRVSSESVTLPPRSSLFINVECDQDVPDAVIAEGNLSLLFAKNLRCPKYCSAQ